MTTLYTLKLNKFKNYLKLPIDLLKNIPVSLYAK